MGQVQWVLAALLRDKRIAKATHNMLAYRFTDERVLVSDNDDDGESSSGAKLASLLELTSSMNVIIVVSRWFGGVLLGPARFKYIASVGRALLEEAGFAAPAGVARIRRVVAVRAQASDDLYVGLLLWLGSVSVSNCPLV